MNTYLITFDEDGDETSIFGIDGEIDLTTITHYGKWSYACHAKSMEDALDYLGEWQALDSKKARR
jgi:hypothetical protein